MRKYGVTFSILAFFALILTVLSGCAKDEVDMTGTINGFVSDYTNANNPIAGATVTLSSKGLTKTTGSDGRFEFVGIEPGTYTLSVKANNYQATTKQVTVYAGQKANCDFQLEQEKVSIDISPVNLVFGKDVDQLPFSITNNSTRDLSYSISSFLDYAEVSPMMGTIKAKAVQSIAVKIRNRNSIANDISGQILVNIGNDSYTVNLTINGTSSTATTGNIAGTITEYANAGVSIQGAVVTLTSAGMNKTTGADGRYEFTELSPGKHTISVSANGFETTTKDVMVEAGKTTTCDVQLQKGSASVEVLPFNLNYPSDVEEQSFTIKNNSSNALSYTLSNMPDFVQVSSSNGMIASKGSQAIKVNVLNRKQITSKRSGQMTVNVGDNAYVVSINVDPYHEEAVSVDINPAKLTFGKNDETLTLQITSKNSRTLDYAISSDLDLISVSPEKGTIKEKGTATVSVSVKDRKKIDVDRNGNLTISIEGNTFKVPVAIAKYETNVSVTPENLSFDTNTEKLSFSIANGESSSMDYTISNNREDILTVSPVSGSLNVNGKVDISVSVKDRKSIASDQHGQISVNVGGKTFYVYVSVSEFKVSASVSPQQLSFDKNKEQLTLTITNNNNVAWDFSVSSDLNILSLSPSSGTIAAKGNATIAVKVNNRSSVTEDKSGNLTLYLNGKSYGQVGVKVDKYDAGTAPSGNVTRGLQAYYSFDDDTADDSKNGYNGIFNGGTIITDTPNGKGKALFLKKGEYVTIPYAPLDGKKNYTVSLWVKDFGTGCFLKCYDDYLYGPTLYVAENMRLRLFTGVATSSDNYKDFDISLANYQSEVWTLITVVTSTDGSNSQGTSRLYINGRRVGTGTSYTYRNSGAVSMSIGGGINGGSADPMKVDNVRIYSVSLTDDEITSIYNMEKK